MTVGDGADRVDLDSAGVYFMSVDDFERRAEPPDGKTPASGDGQRQKEEGEGREAGEPVESRPTSQ